MKAVEAGCEEKYRPVHARRDGKRCLYVLKQLQAKKKDTRSDRYQKRVKGFQTLACQYSVVSPGKAYPRED